MECDRTYYRRIEIAEHKLKQEEIAKAVKDLERANSALYRLGLIKEGEGEEEEDE